MKARKKYSHKKPLRMPAQLLNAGRYLTFTLIIFMKFLTPVLNVPSLLQTELYAAATVYFQAHRGAVDERPEDTLIAVKHAWQFPGAIPEVDVRTSEDGYLFVLHDTSLARTTNAPAKIKNINTKDLPFEEIRKWDAGIKFSPIYKGVKVPSLSEIFVEMSKNPERMIYLDIKNVDLNKLKKMVDQFGFEKRIIFVNGKQQMLVKLKKMFPTARTMTWLSGSAQEIKDKFAALRIRDFAGIDQLQFHLKVAEKAPEITYALDPRFLVSARDILEKHGIVMQLRPFDYNALSLKKLIDLGVHWFVTNAPQKFYQTVQQALALEMGTLLYLQSNQKFR